MAPSYHDIAVPTITEDDLRAFHTKHFPGTALPTQFFVSTGDDETQHCDEDFEDEDDDGLGHYSDGAKRTLTDTQISIFRHSEIQRILWREAGEYSGPIFPKAFEKKASTKSKASKQNSKSSTKDAKASLHNAQDVKKTSTSDISKSAGLPKPGSNITPATAPKRKRTANKKNNRKKTERSAARGWKSKEERARTYTEAQARRANTSSAEPEEHKPAAKKAKTADTGKVEGVRHDPDDFREEGEDFTFRRLARDEDGAEDVAVELDY